MLIALVWKPMVVNVYGHYYGMTDVNRAMNISLYHYTRPKARFYLDTNDEGLLGHQSMA